MELLEPEISVILPTRNRPHSLGQAIRSVLEQSDVHFELIVIDDGEGGEAETLISSLADPRINYTRTSTRRGGNAARNLGLRLAAAPVIAFLDDDDFYLPHKLRTELDILISRPEVDVIVSGFFDEKRSGDVQSWVPKPNPVTNNQDLFVEGLFLRKLRKSTPGICLRRSAAMRVGGFDETLRRRQDFDFLLRLAEVAPCVTISELLWVKTRPADSISQNHAGAVEAMLEFYRRHPRGVKDERYRPGFASDLAKHFSRAIKRREFRAALKDVERLRSAFGTTSTLRLLFAGALLRSRNRRT